MDRGEARLRSIGRWVVILLAAGLLHRVGPAGAVASAPKQFPKSSFVTGDTLSGERSAKGVLLHAQWFDNEGSPEKWFRQSVRFPWPKPFKVSESAFRIRLDGVTYPGKLEIGVFKGTGPNASPAGAHDLYTCTAQPDPAAPCRWIPAVVDGRRVWDVEVDHAQGKGHLYIVAVGTWDDPRDPPKPVGTRGQIGTWIYHAKLAS